MNPPSIAIKVTHFNTRRFAGPALIALAALVMLYCSWETWPDPLVDFGSQLYVPWRLSLGQVLYRDIAYYNGPLSSYLNATAFRIFGLGISTLVWLNLAILIATMTVAYRLTVRAAGRVAAAVGGATFALVFAFSQVVPLGNYNWLTPYTHEITHGTALGLAAIASASRYQRLARLRWIAITGGVLGLVFLTKAEPTGATFAAVAVLLFSGWWVERQRVSKICRPILVLIGCALIAPLVAFFLLCVAMPMREAFVGVIGSWAWAADRRITSLHFYRQVAGLDDIRDSVRTMLVWCAVYLVLIGAGVLLGLMSRTRRTGTFMTGTAFIGAAIGMIFSFSQRIVPGMLTPLPICLACIFFFAARAVYRTSSSNAALRLALVVFAGVLIAKMGLRPYAYHYGFALAWPATVVLICFVGFDLPDWIDRQGGSGRVLQAVALSAWITGIAAILYSDRINFSRKQSIVAAGTRDEFGGDNRAVQVQQVCSRIDQLVPEKGTVVVLPQGLMINYLTRRPSPTRNINFMPPEVLAAGESNILIGWQQHPPDAIVLTPAVIENGFFTLDHRDPYGAATYQWVLKNYQPADALEAEKLNARRGLVIMVRK